MSLQWPATPMKAAQISFARLNIFRFATVWRTIQFHQRMLNAQQGSLHLNLKCLTNFIENWNISKLQKRYYYCTGGYNCNLTDDNGRPNSAICWLDTNFDESTEISTAYKLNCVSFQDDILSTTIYQLNFNCDEELEPRSVCDIKCSTKEKFKKSQLWMCFVVMGLGIGR